MEEKESIFEDQIEQAYWDFKAKNISTNFSERDCFKMACRKNLKPKQEERDE